MTNPMKSESTDTRPTLIMDIQETHMIVSNAIKEMRELRNISASAHSILNPVKKTSDGAEAPVQVMGGEVDAVEPSLRDMVGDLRNNACNARTLSETTRMNVDSLVTHVLRRINGIKDDVLQVIDHTLTAHKQLSLVNNSPSLVKEVPTESVGNSCPYVSLAYDVLFLADLVEYLKIENADLVARMDGIFGMSLAGEPVKGPANV